MLPLAWLKFRSAHPRPTEQQLKYRQTLTIEALEDRAVPATLVVSTTADTLNAPPNDPISLRDAIRYTNTQPGDNQILIPEGVYTLTRNGDNEDAALTGDLDVLATSGTLTIQGAGAGKTIIDANRIDRIFDIHPGARLLLFDVTVRGGLASFGGGFHNRGQLEIHNSIVEANTATSRGGAVDNNATSATFASQNSSYIGNFVGTSVTSTGLGGAINNGGGTIQINDGLFRDNSTGTLGSGGAIYTRSGSIIVLASTFETNRAGMGGAVATSGGNATFVESTFIGNRAEFSGATAAPLGGAIFGQSEVSINRSTFTQNAVAGFGQGGALANSAFMKVVNSTISGNTAGATGQPGAGAGISNSGGFQLIHSTVTQNKTLGGGFGDGVRNAGSGFLIYNSIVAQNGNIPGNNGPDTYGQFSSQGGNIIGVQAGSSGWISTDQVGSQFTPIDPRLGSLQDNGGPTATHALLLGSPAIDRGVDSVHLGSTGGVDQRNLTRVVNGTPDVGAYELQPRQNGAPEGAPDEYSVNEDDILTVATADGVLANDTDPDGDPLTAKLVTGPNNGQLTLNANGSFTYTPAANYFGIDSFTYRAFDGMLRSDPVTVMITVNPTPDAPVATDDSFTIDEDSTLDVPLTGSTVTILDNDFDADGNALTAVLVSGPSHGSLTLNANGSFTYTPNANYNGSDSFTYKASDGVSQSDTATVSITVRPVNDEPVAVDDTAATDEDKAVTVSVLDNDSDIDGDSLSVVSVTQGLFGTVAANTAGEITYTPFANFHGTDSFTYTVSDGNGGTATATVTVTVRPVNDTPIARDDSYTVDEIRELTVAASGVLANDSDVDGDTLTATLVSGPANGTVTFNADGSFSYRSAAGFSGIDSFTYRVSDGAGGSATATITITVRNVVDVFPDSEIDLKTDSKIAVAILSNSGFDATTQVVIDSLRFGRTGTEDSLVRNKKSGQAEYEIRDVNGDGLLDIVVYFQTSKTDLQIGDTTVKLTGTLSDGYVFDITEPVNVTNSRGGGKDGGGNGGGKGNNK